MIFSFLNSVPFPRHLFLATAAFLVMSFSPALGQTLPNSSSTIPNKQNKIKQLRFEREQVKRQLAEFKGSEKELRDQIREFSQEIVTVKNKEEQLLGRKKEKEGAKKNQEKERNRISTEIDKLKIRIDGQIGRIFRLYKKGNNAQIFAMAKHKDFFKLKHFLSLIIQTDRASIVQFEQLNKDFQEKKEAVNVTLDELHLLQKDLIAEKKNLRNHQNRLWLALKKLKDNQKVYVKYLQELEQMVNGMEAAVVRLEHLKNRKPAAPINPRKIKGKLPAPVKGIIIAGFGDNDPRYNLKKTQRGILIRVSEPTVVKAVAPGRVAHAGSFKGYQKLVVLDHGKGLFTVYGHLKKLSPKKGDWVAQGAPLGTSTYHPLDENYNVYFELRMKGKPQDPMKWLNPEGLKKGN